MHCSLKSFTQANNIRYKIPNIEAKKKSHPPRGYYNELIKKINIEMASPKPINMFNTQTYPDPMEPEQDILIPAWDNIPTQDVEEADIPTQDDEESDKDN